MKRNNSTVNNGSALRYGMFVPLALMIASIVSCCLSYSNAKQSIADDLNDAMFAFVNENRELWTRPDTVAALRRMHETIHKPLIYHASDLNFINPNLKEEAYFTLALVDRMNTAPKSGGHKIASDSIILMPEGVADGLAIQVQGFADCSLASIYIASDGRLPGMLLFLSFLSMTGMMMWRRRESGMVAPGIIALPQSPSLDGIRLTPMQRKFAQMLLDAPDMKVDKRTLCEALWGNKSNAEESLYTLVRRTKAALAEADIEIICNRGESYELRVNG